MSSKKASTLFSGFINVLVVFIVPLLAGLAFYKFVPAAEDQMALNVLRKPLALFSKQPLTGYYRDGYCRSGAADYGNHAVAGVVTEEFLDYSASQGNDLRIVGLTEGCKWCLCTSRWLEAFTAFKDGKISEKGVPKVHLQATHESALNKVDMETFKKFAVDSE